MSGKNLKERLENALESQREINEDVDELLEDQAFAELIAQYGKEVVRAIFIALVQAAINSAAAQGE